MRRHSTAAVNTVYFGAARGPVCARCAKVRSWPICFQQAGPVRLCKLHKLADAAAHSGRKPGAALLRAERRSRNRSHQRSAISLELLAAGSKEWANL